MGEVESIEEADGFHWSVRAGTDDQIGPAPHEAPLTPRLLELLPRDGVFMDVGAHVGHYAVRFAAHCHRVIAIEPNPLAVTGLRRNLELNGIPNVDIHEVAAYDRETTLRLWDPFGHHAGGATRTLAPDEPARAPATHPPDHPDFVAGPAGLLAGEARAVPIDRLDLRVDRIDLVKIDVEGAEARVLHGARDTLARYRPALWIELHHTMYGRSIWDETLRELRWLGYAWSIGGRWSGSTYLRALMPSSWR
jgi:FkbM family methyltransferase